MLSEKMPKTEIKMIKKSKERISKPSYMMVEYLTCRADLNFEV